MIIQTGMRTDIPAFYSEWLMNRIQEGFVLVRNPYNPTQVTKYSLSPEVVDLIAFCTKNPAPMLPFMEQLTPYGQYWFVTITPYGRDIEPNVPDTGTVMDHFKILSDIVGVDSIGWRYDPILVDATHTVEWHISEFEKMAAVLHGYTETCVISFIDIYKKVERNFPEAKAVSRRDRITIGKALIEIAAKYGMTVRPCAEGNDLAAYGADCSGCMTVATFEKALHNRLEIPKRKINQRNGACACVLGVDIGAYDTCGHLCKYCYANADISPEQVVHSRYIERDGHRIGYLSDLSFAYALGLRTEKPEKINIVSNIESQQHGRNRTYAGLKLKIHGSRTEITDENYAVLAVMSFVINEKRLKACTVQNKKELILKWLDERNVKQEDFESYYQYYPKWTPSMIAELYREEL